MIQPAVWIVLLSGVAASHLQKSPRVASIMTSLIGGRQAETELLAIRQSYRQQEPTRIAVAKRRITENSVIPGLEGAFGPTRAGQNPRARDFEYPRASRLALLGVGLDDKGDVGVGPVDRLDRAFHGPGMIHIVSRARVVRGRRAA